jgi:hypothetical protein
MDLEKLQKFKENKEWMDIVAKYEQEISGMEVNILEFVDGDNEKKYSDEYLSKKKYRVWKELSELKVSEELSENEVWKMIKDVVNSVVSINKEYKPQILSGPGYENLPNQLLNNYYTKDLNWNDKDVLKVERSVLISFVQIINELINMYTPTNKPETNLDPYYDEKQLEALKKQ